MKTISEIMSHKSQIEYLESCRLRYQSRNRMGRSAMIDEVIDTLGWNRKHAIRALNGKKPKQIIIAIMRKLLHQIYGILKSGQPYHPQKRGFAGA